MGIFRVRLPKGSETFDPALIRVGKGYKKATCDASHQPLFALIRSPMPSCLSPFLTCLPGHSQKEDSQPQSKTAPAATTSTTANSGTTKSTAMSSKAKIAVLVYSMYGHVATLSDSIVEGLKEAGVEYKVFQFSETLPGGVLEKMHAHKAPIQNLPEITPDELKKYDGFILGFPTRYGRAPAQVSAFFDQCGGLWVSGALVGKFATIFTSTASQHGGLETTQLTTLPFLVHQGVIYVPLGYQMMEQQGAVDHMIGSSAYGAGTVAGGQGQLQPDQNDLAVAKKQGSYFATVVSNSVRGASQA